MMLGGLGDSCSNRSVGMNGNRWPILVGIAFLVSGCVTTWTLQYPGTQVVSRRLAAFPSEGIVWHWDFYGNRTADEKSALETRQALDEAINYRLRRHGGHSFGADAIAGLEHAQEFRSWSVDTLVQIHTEHFSDAEGTHDNVGDFRFSKSLESWRAPLDADFVLITFFLDGHDTKGRAIAVAVSGGYHAARRAISCAVHLHSGRVVWGNLEDKIKGDLRSRWGAQQEVDLLLGDMLSRGEAAASEPPPASSTIARLPPADDVAPPPLFPPPPPPTPGAPSNAAGPVFHAAPSPAGPPR
jgi:hypothetical protein